MDWMLGSIVTSVQAHLILVLSINGDEARTFKAVARHVGGKLFAAAIPNRHFCVSESKISFLDERSSNSMASRMPSVRFQSFLELLDT